MTRRLLAILAALAAVLAALAGEPYAPRLDAAQLAAAIAREEDHVTALELAAWIRDRKPGLRILDLRPAAELDVHLPRAERVAIEAIPSVPAVPGETIVLISDGGAHAAQAWVLLRTMGHERVYFLRGGIGEWIDEILNPAKPSDLTRYFGGMPRGGEPELAPVTESIRALRRRGC
jgi:rhodanese-related sulfurtransferase